MPLPPLPASGNGGASQSILCCLHPRARSVHRPARSHTRGSVPYERTARALTTSRTVHFSPTPPCSRKLTKNSRVARARRGPVQLQNWPSPRPGPGHPQTGPGHPPGPVRFPAWPGPPPWPGPGRPGLDPVRAQARADWPGPPTGPGHSWPGLGRGAEAPDDYGAPLTRKYADGNVTKHCADIIKDNGASIGPRTWGAHATRYRYSHQRLV